MTPTPDVEPTVAESSDKGNWWSRFRRWRFFYPTVIGACVLLLAIAVGSFLINPQRSPSSPSNSLPSSVKYTSIRHGFSLMAPADWQEASPSAHFSRLAENGAFFNDESGLALAVIKLTDGVSAASPPSAETISSVPPLFSLTRSVHAQTSPLPITLSPGGTAPEVTTAREDELFIGGLGLSDTSEMLLSEDSNFTGASWQPFSAIYGWTFSGGDGVKEVHAQIRFGDGHEETGYGQFIVDTTPPLGAFGLCGPNGALIGPGMLNVKLCFAAVDSASGVTEMRVSREPTFSTALWRGYSDELDWPFFASTSESDAAEDGETGKVYAQVKDAAGHISETLDSDYIVDKTGPVVYVEVAVPDDDGLTRSVTIMSYDELTGLGDIEITNDPLFIEGAQRFPFTSYISGETYEYPHLDWTFDEHRVVWVRVSDSLGNWSEPYPTYAAKPEGSSDGSAATGGGSSDATGGGGSPGTPGSPPAASPAVGSRFDTDGSGVSGAPKVDADSVKSASLTDSFARQYLLDWKKVSLEPVTLSDGRRTAQGVYEFLESAGGTSEQFVVTHFEEAGANYFLIYPLRLRESMLEILLTFASS